MGKNLIRNANLFKTDSVNESSAFNKSDSSIIALIEIL